MKRLILLFSLIACALVLAGCSHDHPLTDHQHEVPVHNHNDLFTLGLLTPYIVSVDPPLTDFVNVNSGFDEPITMPFGYLTKRVDGREVVYIRLSSWISSQWFDNLEYPDLNTTPVNYGGSEGKNLLQRLYIQTDCGDPDHTGYIAFRFGWGRNKILMGSADFVYKCPEEEESHANTAAQR